MGLRIEVLNLGDIRADWSFTVRGRFPGTDIVGPSNVFLILGGDAPVIVDAGTRNLEVLTRIGMNPVWQDDQTLEAQLALHDLEIGDVGSVIMTHLHVDHAGQVHRFPMSTPVYVNRRQIEHAFSGAQGLFYAPEDLAHILERMYTPEALGILDLEVSGPVEVLPGIRCEASGGHAPGSLSVLVDTDEGVANICGDVVYEVQDSLVTPVLQLHAGDWTTSGNTAMSIAEEKGAIKRALNAGRFLLPSHDRFGAVVEAGKVVGRIGRSVPGPVLGLDAAPSLLATDYKPQAGQ